MLSKIFLLQDQRNVKGVNSGEYDGRNTLQFVDLVNLDTSLDTGCMISYSDLCRNTLYEA